MENGKVTEPFPVTASVVHDQIGNQHPHRVQQDQDQQGLGSERFNFKVPAGVEVIKRNNRLRSRSGGKFDATRLT